MSRKVIAFVLGFILVFAFIGVIQAKSKEKCEISSLSSNIITLIDKLNANQDYLDFIKDSGYDSVRASFGSEDYYFVYTDNKVKLAESANSDFHVKINCKEMNKIIQAYNDKDPKFKKMILHHIPFGVKVNLFNQCMNVQWCKDKVF
jgi:hypothetical protein